MILPPRPHGPLHTLRCTLLLAALAGCAASPRLQEAREVAADSVKLGGYADLSERFRETYSRERPYLTAAADARERAIDAQRRAAYADITAIADELGFAPSTPIEVGIPDFVDWYRGYRGRSA